MTETLDATDAIQTLAAELAAAIEGEVSTRSRVVDGLLDLRNAAAPDAALVARVDVLLAELPGLTTVPNRWWRAALDSLLLQAAL